MRQFVGYDRFEGERAYRQLTELYRALRLYINFFQPSMKLKEKRREGNTIKRTYHTAQTPYQPISATSVLSTQTRERLEALYQALDPLRLLQQIAALQDPLWQHAIVGIPAAPPATGGALAPPEVRFSPTGCGGGASPAAADGCPGAAATTGQDALPSLAERPKRKYHRTKKAQGPRWWRTRPDPFATVWEEVAQALAANPERTAKSVLVELQQRERGQFPLVQLRTLQRRRQAWRAQAILAFDDQWLMDEVLIGQFLAPSLRAIHEPPAAWTDSIADGGRPCVPARVDRAG